MGLSVYRPPLKPEDRTSWGERLVVWPAVVLICLIGLLVGVVAVGGLLWVAVHLWTAVL